MFNILSQKSSFGIGNIYSFQYRGVNLLQKQIEMTLILFFLSETKVFKIEVPEIIELDKLQLNEALNVLKSTAFEEDEESLGVCNIQNGFLMIKFKHLEIEGFVGFPSQLNLNIYVRYVDYIKAEVVRQHIFDRATFYQIES